MITRNTHQTATFENPFKLGDFDETFPPGSYAVETHEEMLGGLSFQAYRRVGCMIDLPSRSGPSGIKRTLTIKPSILDDALARDAALSTAARAPRADAPAPRPAGEARSDRRAADRADDEGMLVQWR